MYFIRNLGEFYLFLIVNWCMDNEKRRICLTKLDAEKNLEKFSGIPTDAFKLRPKQ